MQANLAGPPFYGRERWSRVNDMLAVIFGQCAEREAVADRLLVFGMEILRVAGIDCDRKTGVGYAGRCQGLGFAGLSLCVLPWRRVARSKLGQTDYVEREIALAKELAPIRDHHGKNLAILIPRSEFCSP